jgi:hypothetical protein
MDKEKKKAMSIPGLKYIGVRPEFAPSVIETRISCRMSSKLMGPVLLCLRPPFPLPPLLVEPSGSLVTKL